MNNNNNCVTTIELYIAQETCFVASSRFPTCRLCTRHDGNGRHRIRLGSCDIGAAIWGHRVDVFKYNIIRVITACKHVAF